MLAFKKQDCDLTLREGIEIYLDYLRQNNKTVGIDESDTAYKVWQCHDSTNVIFGNGDNFDEAAVNDFPNLVLCSFR